jgi:hypothetical protein
MDIAKLLEALEDKTNEHLLKFTPKKIKELNAEMICKIEIVDNKTKREILKKLDNYKYVDEMDELKYGTYIRWIPLDDIDNIHLTKGAIFCEIKITDDGVYLICKNYGNSHKYFRVKFDECLVFQKLTNSELILLNAIAELEK